MKNLTVNDKPVKYLKARAQGKSKSESKEIAGYAPSTKPIAIETSSAIKSLSVREELLKHISLAQITKRHAELIHSDNEAVSVNAVKLSYERIEPDMDTKEDNESITILLKG